MKKIITLALVTIAFTLAAHAQANQQKTVGNNPLYQSSGTEGQNVLHNTEKTTGQPIGGIVVKGGQNGAALSTNTTTPVTGTTVKSNNDPQELTTGSPIGGIVVKGGQNGAAITTGNPIGGIIVKSDKSISEKGIK